MKILCISDHHRHELGSAASLKNQGFDIFYLAIGKAPSVLLDETTKEAEVMIDVGEFKFPLLCVPQLSLIQAINNCDFLFNEGIRFQDFDLILTTQGVPWWVAKHISNKFKIPLVIKLWGFKAIKFKTYLQYRDYYGIIISLPSFIHISLQIIMSNALVCVDNNMKSFLHKYMPWTKIVEMFIVYPTFSITGKSTNYKIKEGIPSLLEKYNDYIFSIVSLDYINGSYTEKQLFDILVDIAKKNPDIKVIVVGTSISDFKKVYKTTYGTPENIVLLGKIYSDKILSNIYKKCKLVVTPILYGETISNRLLEAFFYGKPILTNGVAKKLFPELEHGNSVFISDDYEKYGDIVSELLADNHLLEILDSGSKNAFINLFSSYQNGIKTKNIVEVFVKTE